VVVVVVIDPAKAQGGAELIALGRVVVDDVEDHSGPRRASPVALEFGDLPAPGTGEWARAGRSSRWSCPYRVFDDLHADLRDAYRGLKRDQLHRGRGLRDRVSARGGHGPFAFLDIFFFRPFRSRATTMSS
jgi:hypothetical protein